MNASFHRQWNRRERRILRRIENMPGVERHRPMMAAPNIRYEMAEKVRAIAPGGIGAMHLLARKLGQVDDVDRDLHLLKRHLPYHESDHVLNIAYNLRGVGQVLPQVASVGGDPGWGCVFLRNPRSHQIRILSINRALAGAGGGPAGRRAPPAGVPRVPARPRPRPRNHPISPPRFRAG